MSIPFDGGDSTYLLACMHVPRSLSRGVGEGSIRYVGIDALVPSPLLS